MFKSCSFSITLPNIVCLRKLKMYGPYAESLLLKLYILDIIRDFTLQLYLLETGDFISK